MNKTDGKRGWKKVFLWLLLIPVQLVIDVLLARVGIEKDAQLAEDVHLANPDLPGHGAPAFSALYLGVAYIATFLVVAVVILIICEKIVSVSQREKKSLEASGQELVDLSRNKPLTLLQCIGFLIVLFVPIAGMVLGTIWAIGSKNKNQNVTNYWRAYWMCFLICFTIAVITHIICVIFIFIAYLSGNFIF